jgi:hypothetical protein
MKTFSLNLNKYYKRIIKTDNSNKSCYVPPACKDCVYSVNHPPNTDYMVCTLFKYKFAPITYDYTHYVETQICRLDKDLCGPDGSFFKMIKIDDQI